MKRFQSNMLSRSSSHTFPLKQCLRASCQGPATLKASLSTPNTQRTSLSYSTNNPHLHVQSRGIRTRAPLAPAPPKPKADWAKAAERLGSLEHGWGFYIYRTCYEGDEEVWQDYKAELEDLLLQGLDSDVETGGDPNGVRHRMKLRWIENREGLENVSVETVRQ